MNQPAPVVVVATLVPRQGSEEQVEQAVLAAVGATHAQDRGCELYAAHRGKREFVVIEKWESAELLNAHVSGEVFTALATRLDGLLDKPLEATVLRPLPAGDTKLGQL
ncbi:putative quinol monooxygenase [Nocardia asteroides]|uniref:putative quinol monooxygenase n=1 Tax=Nocardia asteroides TaxID=1824 RepID=UPI0034198C86